MEENADCLLQAPTPENDQDDMYKSVMTPGVSKKDTTASQDNGPDGFSISADSESEGKDAYVSEDEGGEELEILNTLDEVDSPHAAFKNYCTTFKVKYGSRKRAKDLKTDGVKKQTISLTKPEEEDKYDFNHKRRGLAVIINNAQYRTGKGIRERKGSYKDANRLKKLFRHLGFDVKRYNNLTGIEMVHKLQIAATNIKYDHRQADCFACAILSHGCQEVRFEPRKTQYDAMVQQDIVFGVDRTRVPTKYLLSIFNDECCPELEGKPRLFFIQACRGKEFDVGTPIATLRARKEKRVTKNKKAHDSKDAVSSESELELESDTDTDSELEPESEDEWEPKEESIKNQTLFLPTDHNVVTSNKLLVGKPEVGYEEQTTDTGSERSMEMKRKVLTGMIESRGSSGYEKQNEPIGNRPPKSDLPEPRRNKIIVSPPPIYKDFLLLYAAPPGYSAWRNKHDGSWMIQSLKKTMMTDSIAKVSFSRLLTQVCRNVAIYCESKNRKQELDKRKLVPCVMSMLTKDIYFRKK